MKIRVYFIFNIIIALAAAAVFLFFLRKGSLEYLELKEMDLLFKLRGQSQYHRNIIIVKINEESIAKIGEWPFKRSVYASAIKALNELGAKSIYLDMALSESSLEGEDNALIEVLKSSSNVYVPFVFLRQGCSKAEVLLPQEKIQPYIEKTGFNNLFLDEDGILRRVPVLCLDEEYVYYHVGLRIAMDYLGMAIKDMTTEKLILFNSKSQIDIPLDSSNKMLINWAGQWGQVFKQCSFLQLLDLQDDSLADKGNQIDKSMFKDSICLIGVTAAGLRDVSPIPLQVGYPNIGALANIINTIVGNNFIKPVPYWVNWLVIYLLALIPALIISAGRLVRESLILTIITVIFVFTAVYLFKRNILIATVIPVLTMGVSYFFVYFYNTIRVVIAKQKFLKLAITDSLTGLYNIRYFKKLLKEECVLAKTDNNCSFCVIMLDIDYFKKVNDQYGHLAGDLVLKEISCILKNSVRQDFDVIGRYGGEEIIILLRRIDLNQGKKVAEKIRQSVENYVIKNCEMEYKVTISLGVTVYKSGDTEDTIISRADKGLYLAKNLGRNRVESASC